MEFLKLEKAVEKVAYNLSDPEHKRFPAWEICDWLESAVREIYEYCKIYRQERELLLTHINEIPLPEDFIAFVDDGVRLHKIEDGKLSKVKILKYKTLTGLKAENPDWEKAEPVELSEYYYSAPNRISEDEESKGRIIECISLYPPLKSTLDVRLFIRYYSYPPYVRIGEFAEMVYLPVPPDFFDLAVDGATAIGMEKKGDKTTATKFLSLFKQNLEIKKRQYYAKFFSDSEKGGRIIR